MITKTLKFLNNKVYTLPTRQSALFINGAKATDTFVFVTPYIDAEQITQRELMQNNLLRRRSHIDLDKVEDLWNVYEELKQKKTEYDKKKAEIASELAKLIKIDPESHEIKKLKIQVDLLKDNIKKLRDPLWSAEEQAKVQALKLPNILHPLTPDGHNKIIYQHLQPPKHCKDHLEIGRHTNSIELKKNNNYYLKGDAAVFELGAKFYFSDVLRKNKYIQFSNADFVKSVIVEGCGEDHTDPETTFILHQNEDFKTNVDNRLHLTGGASLSSFFAYHSKNIIYSKVLPLKYFAMGRQYVPSQSGKANLFNVSQSSVIQLFGATKTSVDADMLLNELIEILKDSYSSLGYHYRLSIIPADKLAVWESLRVVMEMYSTSLKNYIEVANISISGDFISKRLMFTYSENKESKFPHIVSGTILNIPKFLACVLEQDMEFSLPKLFRVENWKCKQ